MVKKCRPPAEHNFLIESIKALHVYSRIMIVVNKLMQPPRSHGINVNGGGTMAAREGEWWTATRQRNNLQKYMYDGDFPYLGKKLRVFPD